LIPTEQLVAYLKSISDVQALTTRDLRRIWTRLDLADMKHEYPTLFAAIRDIVHSYGEVSAVTAADFYEALNDGAKAAVVAKPLSDAHIEKEMRSSLVPLWMGQDSVALSRLAGSVSLMALWQGRETAYQTALRYREFWVRVPQGKTCAFCMMMASRGGVYVSKATAERRKRDGDTYHPHCDCGAISISTLDDLPDINRELQADWYKATGGKRDKLTAWRDYVRDTYQVTH
jgi:hypothetical protein